MVSAYISTGKPGFISYRFTASVQFFLKLIKASLLSWSLFQSYIFHELIEWLAICTKFSIHCLVIFTGAINLFTCCKFYVVDQFLTFCARPPFTFEFTAISRITPNATIVLNILGFLKDGLSLPDAVIEKI